MTEWVSVLEKLPDTDRKKYLVKTDIGEVKKVFFMPDRAAPFAFYGIKSTNWMETPSAELIYGVTHWKELNKL
jgi:uncharacterized protein involved in high-affinity Fe2+ transport